MRIIKSLILAFIVLAAGTAWAATPREQLKQMVEQLQQTPGDIALREKIIKLAHGIKPAPAIPEEARRYLARGKAALELAKTPDDFKLAQPEFQNAANAAPWWPEAYLNLARVQEKTEDYNSAISSYHLYLAAAPKAKDADSIRDQTYKLEFQAEQKAKTVADKIHEQEEQRKRDQQAEEERQRSDQQAMEVIRRVQSIVSGKQYERWIASAGNPYQGSQSGVTEAGLQGSVWWGWPKGKPVQQYVIEGKNIVICFLPDGGGMNCEYSISGTPAGPNISDIAWSLEVVDGSQKKKKRVWGKFYEDSGEFMFSGDRPLNPSEYSPNAPYYYQWYRVYPVR